MTSKWMTGCPIVRPFRAAASPVGRGRATTRFAEFFGMATKLASGVGKTYYIVVKNSQGDRITSMPTRRSYGDACGIARALDVVGERWALLVVRELLLGPQRF